MHKLTKRQFLQLLATLGLQPLLSACGSSQQPGTDNMINTTTSTTVLIIGAGAAGLTAAYQLLQAGVDFLILEAAANYGGRMKRTTTFSDFPIPLGAEWLHASRAELGKIANDLDTELAIQTQAYRTDDSYGYFEDGELTLEPLGDFSDLKFIHSTWFDFFDAYLVPPLRSAIRLNTEVVTVNYQTDSVEVTTRNGTVYTADKVIVTVPLKILQDGDIHFMPALPAEKTKAINEAVVWGGIKVFIAFSEKFYPTLLETPDSDTRQGQQAYYDAAYGQDTNAHILGLFAVGQQADKYLDLSGQALIDFILAELDEMFAGQASKYYDRHIVQNWSLEPFIRSAYLENEAPAQIPATLARSVNGRLYFAGEAYTRDEDWGAVHNASQSARDAVQELLSLS